MNVWYLMKILEVKCESEGRLEDYYGTSWFPTPRLDGSVLGSALSADQGCTAMPDWGLPLQPPSVLIVREGGAPEDQPPYCLVTRMKRIIPLTS